MEELKRDRFKSCNCSNYKAVEEEVEKEDDTIYMVAFRSGVVNEVVGKKALLFRLGQLGSLVKIYRCEPVEVVETTKTVITIQDI